MGSILAKNIVFFEFVISCSNQTLKWCVRCGGCDPFQSFIFSRQFYCQDRSASKCNRCVWGGANGFQTA